MKIYIPPNEVGTGQLVLLKDLAAIELRILDTIRYIPPFPSVNVRWGALSLNEATVLVGWLIAAG